MLICYILEQVNNSVSSIQPAHMVAENHYTEMERIGTFPCGANSREAEVKQASRQRKLYQFH